MNDNENERILLIKWETELIDLDRILHNAIEKSKQRIYELKLEFAKRTMAEPIVIKEKK